MPTDHRRPFRFLWLTHLVATLANELTTISVVVLVFGATGSALQATGVLVARNLPPLLCGPFVGSLVDRWPRRPLLVLANLLRAGCIGLFLLAAGSAWCIGAVAQARGSVAGARFWRNVVDGFAYLRRHRLARTLIAVEFLESWPHGVWTSALMLSFTVQALGAGVDAWGYQSGAFFAGQLLGALLAPSTSGGRACGARDGGQGGETPAPRPGALTCLSATPGPAGVGPAWRAGGGQPPLPRGGEEVRERASARTQRRAAASRWRAAALPAKAATTLREGADGGAGSMPARPTSGRNRVRPAPQASRT